MPIRPTIYICRSDIPIAMVATTVNSNGERTGFLNLTIDKALTIPRDKATFPEITLYNKSYDWKIN